MTIPKYIVVSFAMFCVARGGTLNLVNASDTLVDVYIASYYAYTGPGGFNYFTQIKPGEHVEVPLAYSPSDEGGNSKPYFIQFNNYGHGGNYNHTYNTNPLAGTVYTWYIVGSAMDYALFGANLEAPMVEQSGGVGKQDSDNLQAILDSLKSLFSVEGFTWGLGTAITFWGVFVLVHLMRDIFAERDE